jgi:uncharacterized metal-binding protein YceD (DUF177 family)
MSVSPPLISRRLPAVSIPKAGKTVRLEADAAALANIASHLGLASCERIVADFTLVPARGDGLHVTGTMQAAVHQTCIISLDAFPVEVREDIDVRYAPPEKLGPVSKAEIERTLDDEDPPEPLDSGCVDLWALAIDHLAVALDPYPRKPGVALPDNRDSLATESPFAALASLRTGLEK